MGKPTFNFTKLIWPIEPQAFFQNTWEKSALSIIREHPDYYSGLLGLSDVDSLIHHSRPEYYEYGPRFLRIGHLMGNLTRGPLPATEVAKAYAQGMSILIHAVDQRWPAIGELCRILESELSHPVNANLYLTPKGVQGFGAHFDPYDVFIIQLEGHKHWRLYGPGPTTLPLRDHSGIMVPKEKLGAPIQELVLKAGDALYIPRGCIHEAFTREEYSMHLTLGVRLLCWVDLLSQGLAQIASQDERFRRALPPQFLGDTRNEEAIGQTFFRLLQVFADKAKPGDALEALTAGLFNQLTPQIGGRFEAIERSQTVDLDTRLEKKPHLALNIMEKGSRVWARVPGGRFDDDASMAPSLRYITQADQFCARQLPGDLTDELKLTLVRRLLREGVLKFSDSSY